MGNFESRDYNKVRRKGKKEFICRPTLIPARKILRMRARYNMLRDGVNMHKVIKSGNFALHWRDYATR